MKNIISRLWKNYLVNYKLAILLIILSMIVVAAATTMQAKFLQPTINSIIDGDKIWKIVWISSLLFLTFVLRGIFNYIQSTILMSVGFHCVKRIQKQMLHKIIRLDLNQITSNGSSSYISRFITDISYIRNLISSAITVIFRDVLTLIGLITLMFFLNWRMAIAAAIVFPCLVVPVTIIGRKIKKYARSVLDQTSQLATVLDESFKGIKQIKAFNGYKIDEERSFRQFNKIYKIIIRSVLVRTLTSPIIEILTGFVMSSIMIWGGYQVIHGQTTIGAFMAFFTAMASAYRPIRSLSSFQNVFQEGISALERVFEILDTKPLIIENKHASNLIYRGGQISFKDVKFHYETSEYKIIDSISFDIKAGNTVALVGPSGGGKTTIFNLIMRFYDPQNGSILIDQQNINKLTLSSLRKNLSLVTQENWIFNDTIENNVKYSKPTASKKEVIKALENANALNFINDAPQGIKTIVGEMGTKLSGGQRQRITIARAFLKNAPILLLDEPTSALDTESEKLITLAIKKLMHNKTTIIIAHRLSTIKNVDKIYVIDKGKIVEQGTHQELINNALIYNTLQKSAML